MELPFGENPFSKKATPSASATIATAPPPPPSKEKNIQGLQSKHKRKTQVTIIDPSTKGDAFKKSKGNTGEASSTAALIFGDLAKDNFRYEDISNWSKRGKTESSFCFKQALGETFFHGLDLLNSLESENSKLQSSLNNASNSRDYYKGLADGAEKTIEDERLQHKNALKAAQDELTRVKGEAKAASDFQEKEISRLQAENEKLLGEKDMELSQAFSTGFAAYLQNFLAADPDYDWSIHFAPSTPAFMVDFKTKNAAAISKAKAGLEAKIASELDAMKQKSEAGGSNVQKDNDAEMTVASPTETTAS